MQVELGECEQQIGAQNPDNCIKSLYDAFDNVYDDINALNAKE